MKRVLWISRHVLTEEQMTGLKRYCRDEIELICRNETVENMEELLPDIEEADVIAAVLPIHLLAQLVKIAGERPVLIAMANRTLVPGTGREPEVQFAHHAWRRVARLELQLEPAD